MDLNEIELKLNEHERKIVERDVRLTILANMLQTGIGMLVSMEVKVNALIESQARLYGTVQQLAEAQKRTEATLERFIERSGNGHRGGERA